MPHPYFDTLKRLLGVFYSPVSHSEKLISGVGGTLSILAVLWISQLFLPLAQSTLIVASMGASAVLLFAVPHGPLSQPWPLMGGHLVSAAIGVSCALWVESPFLAAGLAVGLSISAMYYLNCIHPPGGATALTAVIGGESIHALGYAFVWTPVLLNVLAILLIAVLFNALFHWRRYPAFLQQRKTPSAPPALNAQHFSHEDFLQALKEIDSFVDINEYDLQRIYEVASRHAHPSPLTPEQLRSQTYYSNGCPGKQWQVRQMIAEQRHADPEHDKITYQPWLGDAQTGHLGPPVTLTRQAFAQWVRYPVKRDHDRWVRITPPDAANTSAADEAC
jgi:hypothetical protein